MIVLGLDPGIALTGYGVLIPAEGASFRVLAYGALTTPSNLASPDRLRRLFRQLTDVFAEHRPQEVAVEQLFFNRNVTTALTVGQARGVALLAAAEAGAAVFEYSPAQVKSAVTGSGRAVKRQVQYMVRAILNLPEIPQPDDVADALAVAVCHCYRRGGRWGG
ncbi:MAG: crossover junction endodeoxyribonuclease RuvC [Thermoanaerobacterales bacterium]|nr:crossover junction endodeoxyribonuclease RuvC [Thermoanaerobacterales bacterium]